MVAVTLVWNASKTECVGFVKEESKGRFYPGSDENAEHAAGGPMSNPVSSLADYFREANEDYDAPCSVQHVEIDQSLSISVEKADY